MRSNILLSISFLLFSVAGFSQDRPSPFYKNWHLADKESSGFYGISWEKAFDLVRDKNPKSVIVAVIDSGSDTTHEAIRNFLWTNPNEISGNGLDDDRNGYKDDIHGWDFIGGKDSSTLEVDSYEYQRVYFEGREKYERSFQPMCLHNNDSIAYVNWQAAAKLYKEELRGKGKDFLEANKHAPPNYRDSIVKDDYTNINDRFYGNNDVIGGHPLHGTHVAGIIKGLNSESGSVKGVHSAIKLMIIRVVPIGDEHDKDVALAIRYAVDNGARIINMSFGKPLSPEKKWVDNAVKYAEGKNVLIVHSAGNEAANTDSVNNFPNPFYNNDRSFRAANWIEVGASGDSIIGLLQGDGGVAARFSNYGKTSVDVFAPGMVIYSAIPAPGTYGYESGTSMAAPIVSGLAAFILSYYPEMSATQLKEAIEGSVRIPQDLAVKPGTNVRVRFSELCKTGGIVNLFGAIVLKQQKEVYAIMNEFGSRTFKVKNILAKTKKNSERIILYNELKQIEKDKNGALRDYITKNPFSSALPLAIRMAGFDDDEKQAAYLKLNESQKTSDEGKELKKELDKELARHNSIPPDFSLLDSKGKLLQLQPMLKGKVTLIDFWASWCGPCRRDFSILKILYDRLHSLGLEIIGVSIDKDPRAWRQAIKQDKNPWYQVVDTASTVYNLYEGDGVPRQILIDKLGKIVEWDSPFDINQLEMKIITLLSK